MSHSLHSFPEIQYITAKWTLCPVATVWAFRKRCPTLGLEAALSDPFLSAAQRKKLHENLPFLHLPDQSSYTLFLLKAVTSQILTFQVQFLGLGRQDEGFGHVTAFGMGKTGTTHYVTNENSELHRTGQKWEQGHLGW